MEPGRTIKQVTQGYSLPALDPPGCTIHRHGKISFNYKATEILRKQMSALDVDAEEQLLRVVWDGETRTLLVVPSREPELLRPRGYGNTLVVCCSPLLKRMGLRMGDHAEMTSDDPCVFQFP